MSEPTFFECLGLPCRFDLDPAEIERAYLERSRALHPDFHQLGSAAEQRVSLEMTSLLNLAYSTLKQPFKRADYLLTLAGGPSASEWKQMSPEFLEEMLELRMTIQELRMEGPESAGLAKLEQTLTARREGLIEDLGTYFGVLAAPGVHDADEKSLIVRRSIRQTLNETKYIDGLLNDLRAD
jgi:molecular chaperone HscB